jgi:uncharacterized protein (TIGR03083 family)
MTTDRSQYLRGELAATQQELLTLLHSLTPEQWQTPVFSHEGGWTVATTVAHLVEGERGMSIQVHKIRKGEATVPADFDLKRWNSGVAQRMGNPSPSELFALLASTREKTLAVMETLHDEDWARTGRHPSRGIITIEQYYETMAGHYREHAADIRNALGLKVDSLNDK